MKNLKNQKGITLVALVVTIIVLLILAGVSLSLVAGSDGILGRATNAVDKNQIATIKENVELKVAEEVEMFYEDKYVNRTVDNATSALQYISAQDTTDNYNTTNTQDAAKQKRTQFTSGGATYRIVYDTVENNTSTDVRFYVMYEKTSTKLSGALKSTDVSDGKVTQKFLNGNGQDDSTGTKMNYAWELNGKVTSTGSLIWDSEELKTPSGS